VNNRKNNTLTFVVETKTAIKTFLDREKKVYTIEVLDNVFGIADDIQTSLNEMQQGEVWSIDYISFKKNEKKFIQIYCASDLMKMKLDTIVSNALYANKELDKFSCRTIQPFADGDYHL
jgi:hypothetical protein